MRKTGNGRSLPPTLDAMLPRYLIVLVDLIGERQTPYKSAPFWNRLERATVTILVAAGTVRDCSYLIATLREWPYDAVYVVSTIIPRKQITVIDVTPSSATATPDKKRLWFNVFIEIKSNITNTTSIPVHTILEVDCIKGLNHSQSFTSILPAEWKSFNISAFGMSSCFIGSNIKQIQLIHEFNNKYITENWVCKHKSLEAHRRFCNMMLLTSISSSTFNDKMEVPSTMCSYVRA